MERFYQYLQQNKIAPVYLFDGPERFLLEQAINDLSKHFSQDVQFAMDIQKVDALDKKPNEIVAICEEPAFFTAEKLVFVENASIWLGPVKREKKGESSGKKKGKSRNEADDFLPYLKHPLASTCLVFIAGEEVVSTSRLAKTIGMHGQIVSFPLLKGGALVKWVKNCFAQFEKDCMTQAANFLIMAAGNQLTALYQEIQKIASYVGERRDIMVEDVQAVVSATPNLVVFDLVDAVAKKDAARSIALLQQMLLYGEAEQKLLVLLSGQFKLMYQVKSLLQAGYRTQDIAKLVDSHPYRVQKAAEQVKYFTLEELQKDLEIFLKQDVLQKNGEITLKDGGLEMAVYSICNNH